MAYQGYVWDDESGTFKPVSVELPLEAELDLHVNGEMWVRLTCFPQDLKALALGFLYTAGVIKTLDDLEEIYINRSQSCADVWLKEWPWEGGRVKRSPSGCAGGVVMALDFEPPTPLMPDDTFSLAQVRQMMTILLRHNTDPNLWISGLFTQQGKLLVSMQDLDYRNTVHKMAGHCLLKGVPLAGQVLLTSSGISAEMVILAARLGIPVVSGKVVTTRAMALATAWGLTTLGYGEGREIMIYTHPERLVGP
ncbi:MAG: formate dehydrogenase accessory sulfurtransferase FdhD [Rhodovarius sp.]|nr:formate dehydrogenase accessory sulfurtransferase FdhD [Rhodovarius sp.]